VKGNFTYFIYVSGEEIHPKTQDLMTPELPLYATAAQSSSGVDMADTRHQ